MLSQLCKLVCRLIIARVASIIIVITGIITKIIICTSDNKYTTIVQQLENLLEALHKALPSVQNFVRLFFNYPNHFVSVTFKSK